jgi:hypothetical protein
MDPEKLKQAAAHRRSVVQPEQKKVRWDCSRCLGSWATERGWENHFCKEGERFRILQEPVGKVAYEAYSIWNKKQKRAAPPPETFIASRHWTAFINFATMFRKATIPNLDSFVDAMVRAGQSPTMWCNPHVYATYLEWYDNVKSPIEQLVSSLDWAIAQTKRYDVEPKKLWATMEPDKIISAIRSRHLSPWMVFYSTTFLEWLRNAQPNIKQAISDAIDPTAFSIYKTKHAHLENDLYAAVAEEGF